MQELVFLKLGGSLITDKTQPYTARLDELADLAAQIKHALQTRPNLLLVLGHGSGSFGHTAAKKYGTRDGDPAPLAPSGHSPHLLRKWGEPEEGNYWNGFAEVWYQATTLNRYVIQALHEAGLPGDDVFPGGQCVV